MADEQVAAPEVKTKKPKGTKPAAGVKALVLKDLADGMTQKDAAAKHGTTPATVGRWAKNANALGSTMKEVGAKVRADRDSLGTIKALIADAPPSTHADIAKAIKAILKARIDAL